MPEVVNIEKSWLELLGDEFSKEYFTTLKEFILSYVHPYYTYLINHSITSSMHNNSQAAKFLCSKHSKVIQFDHLIIQHIVSHLNKNYLSNNVHFYYITCICGLQNFITSEQPVWPINLFNM